MRVGTICYATRQGIGLLAKWFRDAGVITDAMVFRHGSRPSHLEWHPGAVELVQRPFDGPDVEAFVESIDVLLQFETPFDWSFIPFCQARGVKVIVVPMHEWWPKTPHAMPDAFICVSALDQQYFPHSPFLEVPVPPDIVWTRRTKARRWLHSAGNLGWHGHKGTEEILRAWQLVKSDATLTVRAQDSAALSKVLQRVGPLPQSVTFESDEGRERSDIYGPEHDCFIFAEKYNGLSLPLREAWASGILTMTSDRFPMNTWLPKEPLIPVSGYFENSVSGAYLPYEQAVIDPVTIAAHVDAWHDRGIMEFSEAGREWAERTSWANWRQRWLDEIAKVLK